MFGIKEKEKSYYEKFMDSFKKESDTQSNIFGKSADTKSWNPLKRSTNYLKMLFIKLIALVVILKISWAGIMHMLFGPSAPKVIISNPGQP